MVGLKNDKSKLFTSRRENVYDDNDSHDEDEGKGDKVDEEAVVSAKQGNGEKANPRFKNYKRIF